MLIPRWQSLKYLALSQSTETFLTLLVVWYYRHHKLGCVCLCHPSACLADSFEPGQEKHADGTALAFRHRNPAIC